MTTRAGTNYRRTGYSPDYDTATPKLSSSQKKKKAKLRKTLFFSNMSMKIEKFDGSADSTPIKDWLLVVNIALEKIKDDKEKFKYLVQYLRGQALSFYAKRVLPNASTLTFNEATDELIARFDVEPAQPFVAVANMKLRQGQTIRQYYDAKMALMGDIGLTSKHRIDALSNGLPVSYRGFMAVATITTPQHWLQYATRLEEDPQVITPKAHVSKSSSAELWKQSANCSIDHCDQVSKLSQTLNTPDSSSKQQFKSNNKPKSTCRICLRKGLANQYHWHSECPNKGPVTTTKSDTNETEENEVSAFCSNPLPKIDSFPQVEVQIKGNAYTAVLDTCSTLHLMDFSMAKTLKANINYKNRINVDTANGIAKSLGSIDLQIEIKNVKANIVAHVLENFTFSLLLGINIGEQFEFTINTRTLKVELIEQQVPIVNTEPNRNSKSTRNNFQNTSHSDVKHCASHQEKIKSQLQINLSTIASLANNYNQTNQIIPKRCSPESRNPSVRPIRPTRIKRQIHWPALKPDANRNAISCHLYNSVEPSLHSIHRIFKRKLDSKAKGSDTGSTTAIKNVSDVVYYNSRYTYAKARTRIKVLPSYSCLHTQRTSFKTRESDMRL